MENFFKKKPSISGRKLFLLWFRVARKFFILLFFAAIGVGAFVWYEDVYHGEWTDEERRAYAESTFQETVFDEGAFRKSVEVAEKRSSSHSEDVIIENDFFAPLPGMEKE